MPDSSFDVVVLFEAIYYLDDPVGFAREARRVLRPGGVLLVCTTNKDLPDFNPSAHARAYFGAPELRGLFESAGFGVELLGQDPIGVASPLERAIAVLKRAAVRANAIPMTMKGKVALKRLVFGKLVMLPDGNAQKASRARRPRWNRRHSART